MCSSKLAEQEVESDVNMSEDHSEDRISPLPDDILLRILSSLSLKQEAIMCAMSKRWRPLWGYIISMNLEAPRTPLVGVTNAERSEKRSLYVDWVNQVISSHKGSTLDQFSIDFDLDKTFSPTIDRWLDFALSRRVQRLDLILESSPGWLPWNSRLYAFPEYVYNHLKTPTGLSSIKCLTSLRLGFVNVTGDVIEHFLIYCPLLERLVVERSASLESIKVVASSPLPLKHLEILHCDKFKGVEMCVPNLVSFGYHGQTMRICIGHSPLLVHLYLGGSYGHNPSFAFSPLSSCLSQLETLGLRFSLDCVEFPDVAEFSNLKELTISVFAYSNDSLLKIVTLLKAAPRLQKLNLKLVLVKGGRPGRRRSIQTLHQYPSLKTVEIVGFRGYGVDCEITLYLFETAIMLEKFIIDRRQVTSTGQPFEIKESKVTIVAKKKALQLKGKAPPGLELFVV